MYRHRSHTPIDPASASDSDPLRLAIAELLSVPRPRLTAVRSLDGGYEQPVEAIRLAAAALIGDLDRPAAPEPPDFPTAA